MEAAQAAAQHADKVHTKAMQDCEADFSATLAQAALARVPAAAWLCEQATQHLEGEGGGGGGGSFPTSTSSSSSVLFHSKFSFPFCVCCCVCWGQRL